MNRRLAIDDATGLELFETSSAFTSVAFDIQKNCTICVNGLSTDSVKIQFSAGVREDGTGTESWTDSGESLQALSPINTAYGPLRCRLVRVGTSDIITVGIIVGV